MSNRNTSHNPGATAEPFEDVVVPHLHAARRLARWLLHNGDDAEDAVQEASLRALRYFRTFTGGNSRAWFLRIVRNTCMAWHGQRQRAGTEPLDEQHGPLVEAPDAHTLLEQREADTLVARALDDLSERARTLLVRREFEGLSYQELSELTGLPLGTVMSGLSRARQAFRTAVHREQTRRALSAEARRRTTPDTTGEYLAGQAS